MLLFHFWGRSAFFLQMFYFVSLFFCGWISSPLPRTVHLEVRLTSSVLWALGVLTWPHTRSSGSLRGKRLHALTVISPVCMRALLSPIRPYCANVCRLSSGRLEKDSYPYAWEPRSRRDLSPDGVLCLPARPRRSHIAGGSEDQWSSAITSSPLHISSLISRGGLRGTRRI